MAEMLIYNRVTRLSSKDHADLRLKSLQGDCSFARGINFVPMTGAELFEAAADYPIVFAGEDDAPAPVALLSLSKGHNALVTEDGRWQPGRYVPAFIRRYPFALLQNQRSDTDQFSVCIDDSYPGFVHGGSEGQPLFDDNGEQSQLLQSAVRFCQQYLYQTERTREFVHRLQALDLLVRRDVEALDSQGRKYMLQDFRVLDLKALDQLDDATVVDLYRQGFLGWIHALRVSMSRLERMPPAATQAA